MKRHTPLAEISSELTIAPYRGGIKLLPPQYEDEMSDNKNSVRQLMNLPINVYFKSSANALAGMMTAMNQFTEAICGPAGKHVNSKWPKRYSMQILTNDKAVITTQRKHVFEEQGINPTNGNLLKALSIKLPWYSRDNTIIGLLGCTIILDKFKDISVAAQFSALMQIEFLYSTAVIPKEPPYKPNLIINNPPLSPRENDCLYYLIQGATAKIIAKKLKLSYRTVEHYLERIKNKMNVSSKSELIEKILANYTDISQL